MQKFADEATTDFQPKHQIARRSFVRRIFRWCVWTVPVVLVLVALQNYLRPKVDEALTAPVVISMHGVNSTFGESNTDPGSNENGLPATCITAPINQGIIDQAEHPLIPLLGIAEAGLQHIDKAIQDYTATLNSQVYVDDKLQDEKFLFCKIRHAHKTADGKSIPFSAFTKFLKPKEVVGQEAIWVAGKNGGKLVAHATGLLNVKRFFLDPDGSIAMEGNRYPIREIGFRNLLMKTIELVKNDGQHGECKVTITRNVMVNGRNCTVFQAVHPHKRPHFEFHIAKIYIDDERNIPIAYEGYLWPESADQPPPLLEKYYYTDIKINVGLTDNDFDPGNPDYGYPNW